MADSTYDKTYRLQGIPTEYSKTDTLHLLKTILGRGEEDPLPKVHSLASYPHSSGRRVSQVATVTFGHVPTCLQDSKEEWTFPTPECRGPFDASSITIDNHFRGFTPLNSIKDADHKIE
jgi:hypothetical protein